ncbi:metallophosphoesterase [Mycoavidus sp. B2-EB]|uniref:metallophosphoesterase n=1 Tax=Mycoavidus sp. B2-EB TaxID=2651972 RepID=UPI001629EA9B|nr:metallophosphoesterase [Mycoavidus sp. B2-EB]BBO59885.1 phosphatase [Mycoavidus sp. B2-EB]
MPPHIGYPLISLVLIRFLLIVALSACGNGSSGQDSNYPNSVSVSPADLHSAFVVLGPNGQRIVRAIAKGDTCPKIKINEVEHNMVVRQARSDRATTPDQPNLDNLPLTCEKPLTPEAKTLSIRGKELRLGKEFPQTIVIIGDTGCRVPKGQSCDGEIPFKKIAQTAARTPNLDLVIHLGDYHYRQAKAGEHADFDTWNQDFFEPADALLKAAPWIMVRGNRESCQLAGQGWWRFLDPRPWQTEQPEQDCLQPFEAGHYAGDYSSPYAIPLGVHEQFIVFDSAQSRFKNFQPGEYSYFQYQQQYTEMEELAQKARRNILLMHTPLLALAGDIGKPYIGTSIRSVFLDKNKKLFPAGIKLVLASDFHIWQHIKFSAHPSHFIIGFSGAQLDDSDLLKSLLNYPDQTERIPYLQSLNINFFPYSPIPPTPNVEIQAIDILHQQYGYMVIKRVGPTNADNTAWSWDAEVYNPSGQLLKNCTIRDTKSACSSA